MLTLVILQISWDLVSFSVERGPRSRKCGPLAPTDDPYYWWIEVQKASFEGHLSSVAQSCLTLCDPMNCSTPGLPVHHKLPEFTQTHVHRVGDAIQQSHPPSSPFPPAPNPSQHQGLFQ